MSIAYARIGCRSRDDRKYYISPTLHSFQLSTYIFFSNIFSHNICVLLFPWYMLVSKTHHRRVIISQNGQQGFPTIILLLARDDVIAFCVSTDIQVHFFHMFFNRYVFFRWSLHGNPIIVKVRDITDSDSSYRSLISKSLPLCVLSRFSIDNTSLTENIFYLFLPLFYM